MIDPQKLLADYEAANTALGDYDNALYEIWNLHPEQYSESLVKHARAMWDATIEARIIHALSLQTHVFVDKLADYILNEWEPEEAGDNAT